MVVRMIGQDRQGGLSSLPFYGSMSRTDKSAGFHSLQYFSNLIFQRFG